MGPKPRTKKYLEQTEQQLKKNIKQQIGSRQEQHQTLPVMKENDGPFTFLTNERLEELRKKQKDKESRSNKGTEQHCRH